MPFIAAVYLGLSLRQPRPQAASFEVVQAPASAPVSSHADPVPGANTVMDAATPPSRMTPVRHFTVASGYGHQVPLGFAIKQNVPRGVRVTFATGVDPDARVDWVGGRAWNKVLATTVAEIGDRIDVGHNKLTILRRNP